MSQDRRRSRPRSCGARGPARPGPGPSARIPRRLTIAPPTGRAVDPQGSGPGRAKRPRRGRRGRAGRRRSAPTRRRCSGRRRRSWRGRRALWLGRRRWRTDSASPAPSPAAPCRRRRRTRRSSGPNPSRGGYRIKREGPEAERSQVLRHGRFLRPAQDEAFAAIRRPAPSHLMPSFLSRACRRRDTHGSGLSPTGARPA